MALTRDELARHCRRRTRGLQQTINLVEELILSLSAATDSLGVPLLKEEMKEIWREQKRHIKCFQDPPGILLYTITGHLRKGGVTLPVFRCMCKGNNLFSSPPCQVSSKKVLITCTDHNITITKSGLYQAHQMFTIRHTVLPGGMQPGQQQHSLLLTLPLPCVYLTHGCSIR